MAEFIDPFRGVVPDRPLSLRELSRSIRLALAAEQEAVHLYEALADASDHVLARKVLQDIADEERVHAGEFRRLLSILVDDEDELTAEGAAEVDAMAAGEDPDAVSEETAAPATVLTIGNLRKEAPQHA